jgi:hypothetical protein
VLAGTLSRLSLVGRIANDHRDRCFILHVLCLFGFIGNMLADE